MMQNAFFIRYKLHHVVLWLALFGLWYYLRYQDFATQGLALKITAIKILDLAMLVYITNLLLIPKFLYKRKYVTFSIIYVSLIAASSFWKINIIGHLLLHQDFNIWDNFKTRVYDNFIPHVLLVSTGAAIKLLLDYAKAQKRMVEMGKEKAEAELDFLKQQINPHFLFNSLNSVYFLIDKKNEEARDALHRFSEMLRYQLYECNGEKIPVEKEMDYLKDYVNLQRLRKGENYQITFNQSKHIKDFLIEPLLLIPFVENSFKHLSHSDTEKNEVHIEVSRENNWMQFKVVNTVSDDRINQDKKEGIGLVNVKRRLELLYPGKYLLDIVEDKDWYKVNLKIAIEKSMIHEN
ncbi:MAG: histidine kinase [Bacteroidota bacterium]|nr:histidine kinase [Bacteroidota bacterium]